MIYKITGKICDILSDAVIIDCGGIGYHCSTTLSTINSIKSEVKDITLFTYLHIKEDALSLFGFASTDERDCFKLLISVSGVGPKLAISMLSALNHKDLILAVASSDHNLLTNIPGVGPKLASRIVLELKDKIINLQGQPSGDLTTSSLVSKEAVNALVSLGYSRIMATNAVKAHDQSLPAGELIRLSLRSLSPGK